MINSDTLKQRIENLRDLVSSDSWVDVLMKDVLDFIGISDLSVEKNSEKNSNPLLSNYLNQIGQNQLIVGRESEIAVDKKGEVNENQLHDISLYLLNACSVSESVTVFKKMAKIYENKFWNWSKGRRYGVPVDQILLGQWLLAFSDCEERFGFNSEQIDLLLKKLLQISESLQLDVLNQIDFLKHFKKRVSIDLLANRKSPWVVKLIQTYCQSVPSSVNAEEAIRALINLEQLIEFVNEPKLKNINFEQIALTYLLKDYRKVNAQDRKEIVCLLSNLIQAGSLEAISIIGVNKRQLIQNKKLLTDESKPSSWQPEELWQWPFDVLFNKIDEKNKELITLEHKKIPLVMIFLDILPNGPIDEHLALMGKLLLKSEIYQNGLQHLTQRLSISNWEVLCERLRLVDDIVFEVKGPVERMNFYQGKLIYSKGLNVIKTLLARPELMSDERINVLMRQKLKEFLIEQVRKENAIIKQWLAWDASKEVSEKMIDKLLSHIEKKVLTKIVQNQEAKPKSMSVFNVSL